jgi:hypothetical protein
MISRRCVCGIAATGLFASLGVTAPPALAKPRPFCRFSLTDGWTDEEPQRYITRRGRKNDPSGVPQVVEEIKKALSIRAEIDVYIAEEEDNAFATVSNGRKIVVADVGFLKKLNQRAGTQWGAIQVMAHEVGHHIAGFDSNRHRGELNADYWSGQALQRLGAARDASTAAIRAVGSETDSPSHPSKHRRAETIGRGWDDARRGHIDYSFCLSCR